MLFESAVPELKSLKPSKAEVEEYLRKIEELPVMPTFLVQEKSPNAFLEELPQLWSWALDTTTALGLCGYDNVKKVFLQLVLVTVPTKAISPYSFLIWQEGVVYDCAEGSSRRACSAKYYILALGLKVRQQEEEAQKAFVELIHKKSCQIDKGRMLGKEPLRKVEGTTCLYTFIPYNGTVD